MTITLVIIGLALLGLGWLGLLRADGPRFVFACASCGVGGALLGWSLI